MTPQELKNSILLRAVQGKLTEQRKEDGRTQDLLPMLHIDKAIPCREIPFDIPDNWLWIPIGSLGESTDTDSFCDGPFGSNLKTTHYINAPEVRIIQLSNIGETGWRDANVKFTSFKHLETEIPRCEVFPGNLVIAKMMPAGRTIEVPDLGTRITLGSDAMKFVPNKVLNKQYLLYAMASQAFLEQVYEEAHGITRVRTTLKGVKSYLLPIPPLAEQKRIVAKIEELMPLVEQYEKAYNRLEQLNKQFPDDMKKSILQLAIQGKLVEQRPGEGTGEELYKQIQAEKVRLIKEGKLKKEKPLSPISEDEIPFDIPESWKWCRIGTVFCLQAGKNISSSSIFQEQTENHMFPCYGGNGLRGYVSHPNTYGYYALIGRQGALCGNINYAKGEFYATEHAVVVDHFAMTDTKWGGVFLKALNLNQYATATAQPGLAVSNINQVLIPIPPLAEQQRIVAKIEELLPLCDLLGKN